MFWFTRDEGIFVVVVVLKKCFFVFVFFLICFNSRKLSFNQRAVLISLAGSRELQNVAADLGGTLCRSAPTSGPQRTPSSFLSACFSLSATA